MITRIIIALWKDVLRLFGKSAIIPEHITRILLVETTRLGDIMAVIPVVDRLKNRYPRAVLTFAVSERFAPLLNSLNVHAGVFPLIESNSARGTLRNMGLVRSFDADIACSMSPSRRNALVVLASRARYRVGYLEARNSVTPFLESTPVTSIGFETSDQAQFHDLSIYDRPHLVATALRAPEAPGFTPTHLREDGLAQARSRLHAKGLPPERPYIVVHPFALWKYRAWSIVSASALSRRIVDTLNLDVIVIGTEGDFAAIGQEGMETIGRSGAQAFPSSDLRDTAALLSRARLFVGCDSGPLHLAATMGIPVVGLYGPATPALTAPPHPHVVSLHAQMSCSPCGQRHCISPDSTCMAKHAPDEVFTAVARLAGVQARVVANA